MFPFFSFDEIFFIGIYYIAFVLNLRILKDLLYSMVFCFHTDCSSLYIIFEMVDIVLTNMSFDGSFDLIKC